MRDTLLIRTWLNESGIVNLDEIRGAGAHWVAYPKRGHRVYYFVSFRNLRPSK